VSASAPEFESELMISRAVLLTRFIAVNSISEHVPAGVTVMFNERPVVGAGRYQTDIPA